MLKELITHKEHFDETTHLTKYDCLQTLGRLTFHL